MITTTGRENKQQLQLKKQAISEYEAKAQPLYKKFEEIRDQAEEEYDDINDPLWDSFIQARKDKNGKEYESMLWNIHEVRKPIWKKMMGIWRAAYDEYQAASSPLIKELQERCNEIDRMTPQYPLNASG